MFGFMVTADGGLTTAGYVITVIAGIILFFLAIYFAGKNSDKKKLTTRQLVFCAVAIALAFITSYLKIFKLPWGGSVTLCSMLFIVLIANWYGLLVLSIPCIKRCTFNVKKYREYLQIQKKAVPLHPQFGV